MENALSETRTKYFQAKENGSPMANQLACFFSPSPASSPVHSVSSSSSRSKDSIGVEGVKRVSRSLFKDDTPPSSGPSRASNDTVDEVSKQNELMVNEFLHDWNFKFPGGSTVKDEEDNLKVCFLCIEDNLGGWYMASAVLHIVVGLITILGCRDVLGIDFVNVFCREG